MIASLAICIAIIVLFSRSSTRAMSQWGTSSETELGFNSRDTLFYAWAANSPQLVLSFCYFAINSECTSMAAAYEWNKFGSSRKGLRVSAPLGEQRSTYFLQLPLRFSLPLMAISGGLHW